MQRSYFRTEGSVLEVSIDGGSYLSCTTSADFKGENGQNDRIIESNSRSKRCILKKRVNFAECKVRCCDTKSGH